MNVKPEAEANLRDSTPETRDHATRVFAQLEAGFTATWFREISPRIWIALVKANAGIAAQFGLTHECLVLGNAFVRDFHQSTLAHDAPEEIRDRLDASLLFVASDSPQASPICAVFASAKRIRLVLVKTGPIASDPTKALFSLLSRNLWRRDLFGETEPVHTPGEFFGREASVDELLAKLLAGAPIAVFGLRKIGKSSLLARVTDLLVESTASANVVARVAANSASIKSGRWTDLATQLLQGWGADFQRLRSRLKTKYDCSLNRLQSALAGGINAPSRLAGALQKDIDALSKAMKLICHEHRIPQFRIVALIDECDHIYPHNGDAGHWQRDFFLFWNTLQAIKRGMDDSHILAYALCGLSPSGVERGSLAGQPNPLFDTQLFYLAPMPFAEANDMICDIGKRMGLDIMPEAVKECYQKIGGHPLMLRKFGSAIHEAFRERSTVKVVTSADVRSVWARRKRDFYNQAHWVIEHLNQIAPDEGRLLRSIADGGMDAYLSDWANNDFREVFANHLERYGLIQFDNDHVSVTIPVISEALRKPSADRFPEQRSCLREIVDGIESAIRTRLALDFSHERSPAEAVNTLVHAIPSNGNGRAMDRAGLLDLAQFGIEVVLQSLNWGDYILALEKHYEEIGWIGTAMTKEIRMPMIRAVVKHVHTVRHNNDHALRELISSRGFDTLVADMQGIRDMFTG